MSSATSGSVKLKPENDIGFSNMGVIFGTAKQHGTLLSSFSGAVEVKV